MLNMNINHRKQSQFELFPGASKYNPEAGKSSCLTKDLTLSLENIIVLCIISIMTLVLFFSFGVEKGKRAASLSDKHSEVDSIQTVTKNPTERPAQPVTPSLQEERVVFPVDIPREILEESDSVIQSPIERTEEQERLFTIQVASFKLEKNAKREADRLKGIGHNDAFVLPKGSHTIVCVGKFVQKNEAQKFSSRLKKRYSDCLVRRL